MEGLTTCSEWVNRTGKEAAGQRTRGQKGVNRPGSVSLLDYTDLLLFLTFLPVIFPLNNSQKKKKS